MGDFTQSYLDSSVSMLVPLVGKSRSYAWSFLLPWTWDLWLSAALLCILTGFSLWFLERKTDESIKGKALEWRQIYKQIYNILYFSFYLPFSSSGDNDPDLTRDISKMVLAVWTFVLFTLSASYTANLTTIFTADQLKPTVTSIRQLIKNQDYVGYLQSSYVKGMLLNMGFKESQLRPLTSFHQYSDALTKGRKNGGVAAVVDELPYVNLFFQYHCRKARNYTIPSQFSYKGGGFGFAFQKGSAVAHDLSTAILNLTESGKLADIQEKWFRDCSSDDTSYVKPNAHSYRWLFIVTGIFLGLAMIFGFFKPSEPT